MAERDASGRDAAVAAWLADTRPGPDLDAPAESAADILARIEETREAVRDLRLRTALLRDSILTEPEQVAHIEAQMWWEGK